MKILFWRGDQVGMIEYAAAEVSGLPIQGRDIVVMNCIWVQTRAQGNNFGKKLIAEMIHDENQASGFAIIGLEDYYNRWMQKIHMEILGFQFIRSIKLKHRKHLNRKCFTLHLMWMPVKEEVVLPEWNKTNLLKGVTCCQHHPLYRGRYGKNGLKT